MYFLLKSSDFSLDFQRYLGSKRKIAYESKMWLDLSQCNTIQHFSNTSTVKSKFNYMWKRPSKLYGSLFTQKSSNLVPILLCHNHISQEVLNLPSVFFDLYKVERKKHSRLCRDVTIPLFFMSRMRGHRMKQIQLIPLMWISQNSAYTWFVFSQIFSRQCVKT